MARRPCFVIQPWGVDHERDVVVLEEVLTALRPWVVQVQTDVPLAQRASWPTRVAAAADHLADSATRQRGDTDGYVTTGWLPVADVGVWAAFVVFAGWALDADAFAADGELVALSDLADSVVLRLDEGQRAAVEAVLDERHLAPLDRGASARRGAPREHRLRLGIAGPDVAGPVE